jgi:hypothetical protein
VGGHVYTLQVHVRNLDDAAAEGEKITIGTVRSQRLFQESTAAEVVAAPQELQITGPAKSVPDGGNELRYFLDISLPYSAAPRGALVNDFTAVTVRRSADGSKEVQSIDGDLVLAQSEAPE